MSDSAGVTSSEGLMQPYYLNVILVIDQQFTTLKLVLLSITLRCCTHVIKYLLGVFSLFSRSCRVLDAYPQNASRKAVVNSDIEEASGQAGLLHSQACLQVGMMLDAKLQLVLEQQRESHVTLHVEYRQSPH